MQLLNCELEKLTTTFKDKEMEDYKYFQMWLHRMLKGFHFKLLLFMYL